MLTPRHRESDLKVARGHITKQGSPVLRWAVVEAIQRQPAGPIRDVKDRNIARRGKEAHNIAKTAAARHLLTCVFYAMRDGRALRYVRLARNLPSGGKYIRSTPPYTGEPWTQASEPGKGTDKTMNYNMSTDARHVHIYLETPEPGVHVHLHLGNLGDEASGEVTSGPTVEGNLKRLKDYDPAHAENIQAAYDGLMALGLTPRVPTTRNPGQTVQPYLRWTHDSHPSGSVAYLNAATLSFAGKNDHARVVGLPGAADRGSEVRFSILSREGVAQALAATRLVVGAG